ncbi:hypothetical protein ACSFA0_16560 [Variovorax sp. LT1P1]|uniref:hypothetical protein n=1 Tax=Variovorax sp. LT1P1 TaxID=3443730 RepID=UPI003F47A1D5
MPSLTQIQARRRLIVVILLCVALGGAALRQLSAPGSTQRDVGTLLMLLWIPIIGNVIAWLVNRMRAARALTKAAAAMAEAPAAPLREDAPFEPHAWVELTLRAAGVPAEDMPIAEGLHHCALVIGNEGFSVRWQVGPGRSFRRGTLQTLPVEFLAPDAALSRLKPGLAFRLLVGEAFIGDGQVLRLSTP